jgi:hypothetical protein
VAPSTGRRRIAATLSLTRLLVFTVRLLLLVGVAPSRRERSLRLPVAVAVLVWFRAVEVFWGGGIGPPCNFPLLGELIPVPVVNQAEQVLFVALALDVLECDLLVVRDIAQVTVSDVWVDADP